MDVAFNQHSHHSRRNNRSSTNLNHLSLAPLTSKMPIDDTEMPLEQTPYTIYSNEHHVSYIEGRSAPTTPGILSRSSSRVSMPKPTRDGLSKSKSSTHLPASRSVQQRPGATTPGSKRRMHGKDDVSIHSLSAADRNDSDWLLRAGALMSSSSRESKGQTWLVSRASSTSLTAQADQDEEALEREFSKERQWASRRGSGAGGYGDADDEFSPVTTRTSFGGGSRPASRFGSRPQSRTQSRRGSRANLFTPMTTIEKDREGYFDAEEGFLAEPDFVDVHEDVYDSEQAADDEIVIKRLAKNGTLGLGVWVEKLMGWSLFAVEEDGDETDLETNDQTTDNSEISSRSRLTDRRVLDGSYDASLNEKLPPPRAEEGGWQDAAWLLSIASKVLL